MRSSLALAAILALSAVSGRVYFEETFTDSDSLDRWIPTKAKQDTGIVDLSSGKWYADKKASQGLQLSQDAHFYDYSAKLDRPLNTANKDLVLQYTVKYEQSIDCGGAYLKLLPVTLDQDEFIGDSDYCVMFGPDICGPDRKVHAIINYNNTNHNLNDVVAPRGDTLSHQYTFWLKKDKSYEIHIDNKMVKNGTVYDSWDVTKPREIFDPEASKPKDWVDEPTIADPKAKKPKDWIDGPKSIPDPEAKKPKDWDDDMDGDWEAPTIPNPKYIGVWKPPMIDNPEYKGEWTHPMIPNPEYKEDKTITNYKIGYIGLDVWTVKSGTILDNILITDDMDYAKEFGQKTWADYVEAENTAHKGYEDTLNEAKKADAEDNLKKQKMDMKLDDELDEELDEEEYNEPEDADEEEVDEEVDEPVDDVEEEKEKEKKADTDSDDMDGEEPLPLDNAGNDTNDSVADVPEEPQVETPNSKKATKKAQKKAKEATYKPVDAPAGKDEL